MKDYSQNKEQKIILDYFGDRKGIFLDCGANDGTTFSNTVSLYELQWNGVLVEPSPQAFRLLKEIYVNQPEDRVTLVNAAITEKDGMFDFYDSGTHLKKGDVALLSTTVPSEMDRWKKSGETFNRIKVRGITFETLMKETGASRFEFMSIDCEGADYDVLTQIDLTKVGCQLLCIEFNQKNKQQFVDYCAKFGMKLLHQTYENLIFAL